MRFVVVTLLTISLASCGLVDDLSTPTGFCTAQFKQECRAQFQCCTAAERTKIFGALIILAGEPYSTEQECVEEYTHICEAFGAQADESVKEGRMEYDADKAASCVDKLKAGVDKCEPEEFLQRDDDCDEALVGAVGDGDKCFSSAECEDVGAECEVETTDGNDVLVTAEGKCRKLKDEGEECQDDSECESDFCDFPEIGECFDTGVTCTVDGDCDVGDFCDTIEADVGACAGGEGEGERPDTKYEVCDGLD